MVEGSSSSNVVSPDEFTARKKECELEWVGLLLRHEPDAVERIEAAHAMITYREEQGLEPWQCLMEFMRRNHADAMHILDDPVIKKLREDYEDRFWMLYRLQDGRRPDIVALFDERMHEYTQLVGDGIHRLKYFANQKRGDESQLSLFDAEGAVESRVTTRIFEPRSAFDITTPRVVSGVVLTTYAPIVGSDGTMSHENRKALGTILSGPAFAKQLGITDEAA